MKMLKGKKGNEVFTRLAGLGTAVAALVITLVVAFLMMSKGKTSIGTTEGIDVTNITQCRTSTACNATTTLVEATAEIPGWVPLIIIGVIGSILLGLVAMFGKNKMY